MVQPDRALATTIPRRNVRRGIFLCRWSAAAYPGLAVHKKTVVLTRRAAAREDDQLHPEQLTTRRLLQLGESRDEGSCRQRRNAIFTRVGSDWPVRSIVL